MEFTEEQKKIFEHDPNKHACILAGPGTGKSSIIIRYISQVKEHYPEKKVRLLTFTRAANIELAGKIIESSELSVDSGTVHSFAISVLLGNPGTSGLPEPIRLADTWERTKLVERDISHRSGMNIKTIRELTVMMSAFWESLEKDTTSSFNTAQKNRFMGIWDEHRRIFGYSLLSELPFRLKAAMEANPELDMGDYDLIAVDEYQDLNACDLKCFKLIADRGTTIIAIGDDDQSIYGFREAHPEGIRRFGDEYKSVIYPLSISHRCGTKILEWANFVIEGETTRPVKATLSPGDRNPEGIVAALVFNRERDEAAGILKLIEWLRNTRGVPLDEILILARTSKVSQDIRDVLKENKIKYSEPEEVINSLGNEKTRWLIAILKILINKDDSLAWLTIIRLTSGIGTAAIDRIYKFSKNNKLSFGGSLTKTIEDNDSFPGNEKLKKVVQDILAIVNEIELPESNESWGKIIQQLIAEKLLPEPEDSFIEHLNQIDLLKDGKEMKFSQYISQLEPNIRDLANMKETDKIRIMSLGASKGLTVRATIIAGAEEEIVPLPSGERQEERRLLYVGMTRSREYLFLTRCRRRTGQSAHSGSGNVAGARKICPFLDGGPVSETDGNTYISNL